MHHAHCALCVFALNASLMRIFLNLKPVVQFILIGFQPIGWEYSCLPSDKAKKKNSMSQSL